ncbi:MAG TPA: hypothetical protein VNO31_54755 [Umezawaea sp.]|nr:hypothetical protein [Umezawaea sp.]
MTEQREVIAALGNAGVLDAVRWAYRSAASRSLDTYNEPDGHDHTLLGMLRFTLFRDRLDRVFATRRYSVQSGDGLIALDLVYDQLPEDDVATMPLLEAGLVRRADLEQSPGWAFGRWRFLLAAGEFGKLDELPWPQRSHTKQRVASRRNPEIDQPTLFDVLTPEERGGLNALVEAYEGADELDLETFVVAHSLDPIGQQGELILGRPKLNHGGGPAWHWSEDLLTTPPSRGGVRPEFTPMPTGPNTVPDARVQLRPESDEQTGTHDGGRR